MRIFFRFLISLWFIGAVHCADFANEEERCAYETACGQATFSFEIKGPEAPPFYIHLTNHGLPLASLSLHTQNLIEGANTVVMEFFPLEDEPLDQLSQAYEVFQNYCIDAAFHSEFRDYMRSQDFSYYEKFKENYEKFKAKNKHPFSVLCNKYAISFEEISPTFLLHIGNRIKKSKNQQESMDSQIDDGALINQKKRTGLESVLQKFILFTPEICPFWENLPKEKIHLQLYKLLHLADQPEGNQSIQNEEKELENRWHIKYKNGQFFQNAFDSDVENSRCDSEFVIERNSLWLPRIEEIIRSPDRYPPPVLICAGSAHHDLLRLGEEKGYTVKILNQNGTWYPFPYTKLYNRFREGAVTFQ